MTRLNRFLPPFLVLLFIGGVVASYFTGPNLLQDSPGSTSEPLGAPGIEKGVEIVDIDVSGSLFHLKSDTMGDMYVDEIRWPWVKLRREHKHIPGTYWVNWNEVSHYRTAGMKGHDREVERKDSRHSHTEE